MKAYKILFAAILMMIATIGMVSAQDSNNPVLKLNLSTYDPIPAEPGQLVDVWINVQNIGNTEARNIQLEYVDSPALSITSAEDRIVTIPVLGAFKDYTVKYTLKVSNDVADGPNDLMIKYVIGNLNGVVSTAKIPIDIKSTETVISVRDVSLNPSPVSAGGKTSLSLSVMNLAKSSNVRNVEVTVQVTPIVSGGVLISDLPFVTMNSGNQKSVDRILPGQSGEFDFDLAVYPSAESKLYKLPVSISYYDDTGRQYNKTMFVGVEVNAKPDLLVTLESADLNSQVNSGDVLFNIINKGTSNLKLMTVTLEDTDQYDVLSPSSQLYLGNIDSDDFDTARFAVKSTAQNEITFKVNLDYKDSLNNEYKETYYVNYKLSAPTAQKKSGLVWFVVIIIVIIVGIVWYRRSRRRKNN